VADKSKIAGMNGLFTILTYFETKYTCTGVCKPTLFYYSIPINKGPPTTNCLSYLKQEIGSSLRGLGIASIVGGVIMGLIWCCQYALWRTYEEDEEVAK